MAAKEEERVAVVLKYDLWDEDENGEVVRYPAAPQTGTDAEGMASREEVTMVRASTAKKLVKEGKASVPLK